MAWLTQVSAHVFLLLLFDFVKEAPLMWLLFQVKHLQDRNRDDSSSGAGDADTGSSSGGLQRPSGVLSTLSPT